MASHQRSIGFQPVPELTHRLEAYATFAYVKVVSCCSRDANAKTANAFGRAANRDETHPNGHCPFLGGSFLALVLSFEPTRDLAIEHKSSDEHHHRKCGRNQQPCSWVATVQRESR